MAKADSVHSTPPLNTSRLQNIHEQEAARQASLQLVRRLRREARDEIEKLIAFLDYSDDYAMTELEDAVDDTGCDEDTDKEGSLGSSNSVDQTRWLNAGSGEIDAENEHDGAEPEDEHGDRADYEPSLGWTTDGVIQNTSEQLCDVEAWT
jgi:hypothetical protein